MGVVWFPPLLWTSQWMLESADNTHCSLINKCITNCTNEMLIGSVWLSELKSSPFISMRSSSSIEHLHIARSTRCYMQYIVICFYLYWYWSSCIWVNSSDFWWCKRPSPTYLALYQDSHIWYRQRCFTKGLVGCQRLPNSPKQDMQIFWWDDAGNDPEIQQSSRLSVSCRSLSAFSCYSH